MNISETLMNQYQGLDPIWYRNVFHPQDLKMSTFQKLLHLLSSVGLINVEYKALYTLRKTLLKNRLKAKECGTWCLLCLNLYESGTRILWRSPSSQEQDVWL